MFKKILLISLLNLITVISAADDFECQVISELTRAQNYESEIYIFKDQNENIANFIKNTKTGSVVGTICYNGRLLWLNGSLAEARFNQLQAKFEEDSIVAVEIDKFNQRSSYLRSLISSCVIS